MQYLFIRNTKEKIEEMKHKLKYLKEYFTH